MKFTQEEITAAKQTRDAIIKENIDELKSVYMAGEIVMWDEISQSPYTALPPKARGIISVHYYRQNEDLLKEQLNEITESKDFTKYPYIFELTSFHDKTQKHIGISMDDLGEYFYNKSLEL